jgi:hypothetical protein
MFSSKKIKHTIENNPKRNNNTFLNNNMTERIINITFRIVFHSILDFFWKKKCPIILFYLFIFPVTIKSILTCGISLDSEK